MPTIMLSGMCVQRRTRQHLGQPSSITFVVSILAKGKTCIEPAEQLCMNLGDFNARGHLQVGGHHSEFRALERSDRLGLPWTAGCAPGARGLRRRKTQFPTWEIWILISVSAWGGVSFAPDQVLRMLVNAHASIIFGSNIFNRT